MSDISIRTDHELATIRTEVDLDWRALGHLFLQAADDDQVEFLLGWAEEGRLMGFYREDLQYQYIAEALPTDEFRKTIAGRLTRLADCLDETSADTV